MAKGKRNYLFCQNCGHEGAKVAGAVSGLRRVEYLCRGKVSTGLSRGTTVVARQNKAAEVVPLSRICAEDDTRVSTGMKEFNECWAEVSLEGSLVLVGGDPGIGKSTLFITGVSEAVGYRQGAVFFRRRVTDSN